MQLMESNSASHTDWSMIANVGQQDEEVAAKALEQMVRRYWPAVYAYIRKTGRSVHESSDLTQGFICDVMISRRLAASADPERGRFRTLLLNSLRNYLVQEHRRKKRLRRVGKIDEPLSMDPEVIERIADTQISSPEKAFSYQWSAIIVKRVLEIVRNECSASGLDAHWTIFERRIVRPMLFNDSPLDYAVLIKQLGLKEESQAANMMVTVKRRFVAVLYAEVGSTVSNETDIDDELRLLLRDLEQPL